MGFRRVVIRKGTHAYDLTKEVLSVIDLSSLALKGKKILVKPNAGRMAGPGMGINTSPDVVASVLDYLRDCGADDLVVGESPILGVKALESLRESGIAEQAEKRGIPLVDMDSEPPETVLIPDGTVIRQLRICRLARQADLIVSVPVMKTHMHTQVSLGLKNMKGCLYEREKVKLHQLPPSDQLEKPAKPLDMAVADMSRVLMPQLTVIDGTFAQEGMGPSAGSVKQAGLVLASLDCLAADKTASRIMGFQAGEVQHLKLSSQVHSHGDNLDTDPPALYQFIDPFERPPEKISLEYLNVKVDDKDSCSACLSTVMLFLKRYYKDFADYFTPDNPLKLSLGKALGPQSDGTVLVGNCTYNRKDGCIFVKGCPPVASDIKKQVDKIIESHSKPA